MFQHQCTIVSFVCRYTLNKCWKFNYLVLGPHTNDQQIVTKLFNELGSNLRPKLHFVDLCRHLDKSSNNNQFMSNMWNQYRLCWRRFKKHFPIVFCRFSRWLLYHALPSAEIHGMVLPVWISSNSLIINSIHSIWNKEAVFVSLSKGYLHL